MLRSAPDCGAAEAPISEGFLTFCSTLGPVKIPYLQGFYTLTPCYMSCRMLAWACYKQHSRAHTQGICAAPTGTYSRKMSREAPSRIVPT
eukprot:1144337-Pelagomonas_calceolata.AAC.2